MQALGCLDGHHIIARLGRRCVLASLMVRGTGLDFVGDVTVGQVGAVIGGLNLHAVTHDVHTSVKISKEIVVASVGAPSSSCSSPKCSTGLAAGPSPAARRIALGTRRFQFMAQRGWFSLGPAAL